MAEHDEAVAAAREHLASEPDPTRPLKDLPATFATTRAALHVVAEHLLKPKRELETDGEIALRFTPGGFGVPPWEDGEMSGGPGQARVEGVELVSSEGKTESRVQATDLEAGAGLLGVDEPEESFGADLKADPEAAVALADWFAFGTVVLAELIDRHSEGDPAPIRLWPEHFDVATELGSEGGGTRANFGASPGDDDHPEPYLYVGPWDQAMAGEPWSATGFVGAELAHAELIAADDQAKAAADFFDRCISALAAA